MHTEITVLKHIMAVRLDVNIWSARKKLVHSDLGEAELPPENLASLGNKKICDPKELSIFNALKGRATSLLDKHGIRFLGGWALPEQKIQEVQDGLLEIARNFNEAKEIFLNRYDTLVQEWINSNPGWESLIATSAVSAKYVRSRLGFSWQVYKITPPTQKNEQVSSGLQDAVKDLGCTLFGEVAKTASESWKKSFAGKTDVTRKALSPLKALHGKLSGLSFVEPRVVPVINLLESAFAMIPARGRIRGSELIMLQGLICLLRDPTALIEHAQKILEGNTPDDILQGLLSNHEPLSLKDTQAVEDHPKPSQTSVQNVPVDSLGLW